MDQLKNDETIKAYKAANVNLDLFAAQKKNTDNLYAKAGDRNVPIVIKDFNEKIENLRAMMIQDGDDVVAKVNDNSQKLLTELNRLENEDEMIQAYKAATEGYKSSWGQGWDKQLFADQKAKLENLIKYFADLQTTLDIMEFENRIESIRSDIFSKKQPTAYHKSQLSSVSKDLKTRDKAITDAAKKIYGSDKELKDFSEKLQGKLKQVNAMIRNIDGYSITTSDGSKDPVQFVKGYISKIEEFIDLQKQYDAKINGALETAISGSEFNKALKIIKGIKDNSDYRTSGLSINERFRLPDIDKSTLLSKENSITYLLNRQKDWEDYNKHSSVSGQKEMIRANLKNLGLGGSLLLGEDNLSDTFQKIAKANAKSQVQETAQETLDLTNKDLNAKISEIENNITSINSANTKKVLKSLGDLAQHIENMEKRSDIISCKKTLGMTGLLWGYNDAFTSQKNRVDALIGGQVEAIQQLNYKTLESNFEKIINNREYSVQELQDFEKSLGKILTDAENSMQHLGISGAAKVAFDNDIASIRQLIGRVKGYEAYLAAKLDARNKAQGKISTLPKAGNYTGLKLEFDEINRIVRSEYDTTIADLSKEFGTSAESFPSLDVMNTIKHEVEANDLVISKQGELKPRIDAVREKVKLHNYSDVHNELAKLGGDISLLEKSVDKVTLKLSGLPVFAQQTNEVNELSGYFESLYKICKDVEGHGVRALEFDSTFYTIKKSALKNPSKAKKDLGKLAESIGSAYSKAKVAMSKLGISESAAGFSADLEYVDKLKKEVEGYRANLA